MSGERRTPAPSVEVVAAWLGFPESASRLREPYERLSRARGLGDRPARPLDRALDRLASWGRPGLALADAFAARFRQRGPLRRRLVLVLALLEVDPHAGDVLDAPLSRGPLGAVLRGVGAAAAHGILLLLSVAPVAWLTAWEALGRPKR